MTEDGTRFCIGARRSLTGVFALLFLPVMLSALYFSHSYAGADEPAPRLLAVDPAYRLEGFDPETGKPLPIDEAVAEEYRRDILRLVAPRGGFATGHVVADRHATAVISSLSGPEGARIGSDHVIIRYAAREPARLMSDREFQQFHRSGHYPPGIPAAEKRRAVFRFYHALHPEPQNDMHHNVIHVTVEIPADVPAGVYEGELTVGGSAVPVRLEAGRYVVPHPQDYDFLTGLEWSYGQLSEAFGVEMWSPEHWQLVSQLYDYIAALGNRPMVVTLLADNYLHEMHGHIRFIRKDDELTPDFSLLEQLLDMYIERVGIPRPLVLHLWHVTLFGTTHRYVREAAPAESVRIPVTVVEPDGSLNIVEIHPPYMQEGAPVWKALLEGMREVLSSRGLPPETLALGTVADGFPRAETVRFFQEHYPEAGWSSYSHSRTGDITATQTEQVLFDTRMRFVVWDTVWNPTPTPRENGIMGGWNLGYPHSTTLRNALPMFDVPLSQFRRAPDMAVTTGEPQRRAMEYAAERSMHSQQIYRGNRSRHGMGIARLRVNFWQPQRHLFEETFPTLWRANTQRILERGSEGPIATAQYEMLREGQQECQARIVIERALVEDRIDGDLARRSREFLAERTRVLTNDGVFHSGAFGAGPAVDEKTVLPGLGDNWQDMARRLFDLAGEVEERVKR